MEAPFDLAPLARALCERSLFALHVTATHPNRWSATFETEQVSTSADATLTALLTAIESLEWSARHAWSACTRREFNIGYEGGDNPLSVSDEIASNTLARAVAVGASLRITVYARMG